MKGILNSEVDPFDLVENKLGYPVYDKLNQALLEPDYLIALVQKSFFKNYKYDIDDVRFSNITPDRYRVVMSECLDKIDSAFWKALEDAEGYLKNNLPSLEEVNK